MNIISSGALAIAQRAKTICNIISWRGMAAKTHQNNNSLRGKNHGAFRRGSAMAA